MSSNSEVSVSLFGVSFKADIDDLRESPALSIAEKLLALHEGAVSVVEPNVVALPQSLARAELCSVEVGLAADVVVILVDHKEFRGIKRADVAGELVDTKGIL